MRKIITFVLAIAMVMACAVSASAESKINLTGDHAGDKEGPGYAEYEVLGLDYDAGAKINEDGLVAEAGFEVHALQGSAEGKLGSEENNVHGGVTGSLGGGRAGAGVSAGLDENGNLKVGAEVGAEAIGAEVGVEGGVTVGGVEANVGAKGKVGVGAKAKAGIEDGKFKLELELVVGLGGEIDIEIDPSNFNLDSLLDPYAGGACGRRLDADRYTMNPMNNMIGVGGPDISTGHDFSGEPVNMSSVSCAVECPVSGAGSVVEFGGISLEGVCGPC